MVRRAGLAEQSRPPEHRDYRHDHTAWHGRGFMEGSLLAPRAETPIASRRRRNLRAVHSRIVPPSFTDGAVPALRLRQENVSRSRQRRGPPTTW